jgi:uncharacterized membrane protein YtjA (UPF0391 family)
MTNVATEERAVVRVRRTEDLAVVGLAVAAAGATWVAWTQVLGVTLEAPMGGQVRDVGLVSVLVSALVSCAAGAGLLRLLEARTTRGPRIWTVVAVVACLLSFGGPSTAPTTAAMTGLASLHVVLALVLVLGLRAVRRGR